jgi:hypothetical protein
MELWSEPYFVQRAAEILAAYRHWLGRDLVEHCADPVENSRKLFHAKFVVVAHGTEADPILNYANQRALQLWEMDWEQFRQTPSRLTAEPVHRDERARMLELTRQQGYFADYSGVRISSTGRRFRIDQALVWNLLQDDGTPAGQAAMFADWTFLDSVAG